MRQQLCSAFLRQLRLNVKGYFCPQIRNKSKPTFCTGTKITINFSYKETINHYAPVPVKGNPFSKNLYDIFIIVELGWSKRRIKME